MIKQLIKTLTTFAILSEFNCYQNINLKNINNFPKTKKTSITALFSEKDSQNQISIKSSPNQLSSILETLTDAEKYNLLIQSKSSSIFEGNKNITEYNILTNLYKEMIDMKIKPTVKSSQFVLNAACVYTDCKFIAEAFSLLRFAGYTKSYGVGIGSLSTINTKTTNLQVELPTDNREKEITSAIVITGVLFLYAALQSFSLFNQDIHPWATLVGGISALAICFEAISNKGMFLRDAAAGLERLVLKDEEREEFIEASGFLLGYLLGLPCFAFQTDVNEAIKMLRDNQESMDAYLLNKKALKNDTPKIDYSSSSSSSKVIAADGNAINNTSMLRLSMDATTQTNTDDMELQLANLGRVLIWLTAPVAAEVMKYGKTVISDPRKPKIMLDVYISSQKDLNKLLNMSDREMLLKWSYLEASLLLKRYADLLEDVRLYLQTRTSSPGECAFMMEDKL